MITVYPILRQQMKDCNISSRELAVAIGDNLVSFTLKIWGIKRWALTDVVKICGFFSTSDVERLFVRNNNKRQFLESQGKNSNV